MKGVLRGLTVGLALAVAAPVAAQTAGRPVEITPAQIQAEILALMGEVTEFYSWFGLEPLLTFGTKPDKALGSMGIYVFGAEYLYDMLDEPLASSPLRNRRRARRSPAGGILATLGQRDPGLTR